MFKLVLFVILLVTCWPLALVALIVGPVLWVAASVLKLSFSLVGAVLHIVLGLFIAVVVLMAVLIGLPFALFF